MNYEKQVEKSHYDFSKYMTKMRWCSMWHQLDEIQKLNPQSILEVGPGAGLFKTLVEHLGFKIETLDLDPNLQPDHVASATDMPFHDASYDVVCAFQMLEHLPYEVALQAFAEMVRVSRRNVLISLPDSRTLWRYQLHLPKLGSRDFFVPRPQLSTPEHVFDGEHYWEINKKGYPLSRVINDFSKVCRVVKTYRVVENSWHRFFICER